MPGASPGDIRAGRAYVEIGADSKELEDKVKKGSSLLRQLNQGVGQQSALGNVGKILTGAGATAGLALGARLLSDMAQGAVKWRDAMAQGGEAAGKANEELLQSIPVLGQIREAGLAIRELFTGEAAATEEITRQVAILNGAMDLHQKIVAQGAKSYEAMMQTVADLRSQGTLIGTSGPWRDWLEQQRSLQQEQKRIQDQASAEAGKLTSQSVDVTVGGKQQKLDPAAARKLLRDEIGNARGKLNELLPDLENAQKFWAGTSGGAGSDSAKRELGPMLARASELKSAIDSYQSQIDKITNDIDSALAKQSGARDAAFGQAFKNFVNQGVEIGKDFGTKVFDAFVKEAERRAKEAADKVEGELKRIQQSEAMKQVVSGVEGFFTFGIGGPAKNPFDVKSKLPDMIRQIVQSINQTNLTSNPFVAQQLSASNGAPLERIARSTEATARYLRQMQQRGGGGLTIE